MSRGRNSQRIASQPSASVRSRAMNLPLTFSAGVPYEVPSSTPGNRFASSKAALNFAVSLVFRFARATLRIDPGLISDPSTTCQRHHPVAHSAAAFGAGWEGTMAGAQDESGSIDRRNFLRGVTLTGAAAL